MDPDLPALCAASPPWSKSALKRLSLSLRDGRPAPLDCPSYEEVLVWYEDLAAEVTQHLQGIDWPRTDDRLQTVQITFRAKTIDTLREKLRRTPTISLGYVQDVAGVRIEADMSTATQDVVTHAVAATFGHGESSIKDLRAEAHSGYRAVHVWLRLPAGRVEVQVRTRLQGQWANAFEALADFVGRGIRYGDMPSGSAERKIVTDVIDLSINNLSGIEAEGNELAAMQNRLDHFRELVVSGLMPADEGHALLDEIEPQIAALREHYSRRAEAYHDLLVRLEGEFRSVRRRR